MNEIKQIHSYLKSREDYYKQKIEELQENCPHEDVVVKEEPTQTIGITRITIGW